jgi:hypothetical protein
MSSQSASELDLLSRVGINTLRIFVRHDALFMPRQRALCRLPRILTAGRLHPRGGGATC